MLTLTNGTIKKVLIGAGVVVVLIIGGILVYNHFQDSGTPVQMQYEGTTKPEELKKTLDIDTGTSVELASKIKDTQTGNVAPNVTYYVTAPTVQQAADDTTKAIKEGATTLPTAALEKTDRTVVTADEDQQKVDVYKINLRNNHKIKAGMLYVEGDKPYLGLGYQAGRVEAMVYGNMDGKKSAAVNYTLKEW